MNKEHVFEILKSVAELTSRIIGDDFEVTIHNFDTKKIEYIVNNHVTRREIGREMPIGVHDYFLDYYNENRDDYNPAITYNNDIKSSSVIIPDEKGIPFATFCINWNMSEYKNARKIIDNLLNIDGKSIDNNFEVLSINKYVNKVINTTLKNIGDDENKESKKVKMKILKELDDQGLFLVRDAVKPICESLNISQATTYNYLRKIRREQNSN